MLKKLDKKIVYPITAIICFVLLGGSLIIIQNKKQASIEYQKLIEIQNEQDLVNKKIEADRLTEDTKQNNLDICLKNANLISENTRSILFKEAKQQSCLNSFSCPGAINQLLDENKVDLQNSLNNCFKQYK